MRSLPVRIENGRIKCNELTLRRFVEKNDGRWCDIIARVPKRSITQNRYYWLYLTVIGDETGNDPDELHELFKTRFLPVVSTTITFDGKTEHTFKRLTSTTNLTKAEFTEYLDKICAVTSVPLPDPQAAGYLPK